MLALSLSDVQMNAHASSKDDALRQLAQVFIKDGLTKEGYLEGLLARENQASTYLGQGIAIPHGTPQVRHLIDKTGVRVMHFADGVVWNEAGDKVYLMVGICAKSDEHLTILKQLTAVLGDDVSQNIKNAKDANEVIDILSGQHKKSLYLHEALIKTDVMADDVDALYFNALQSLKDHHLLKSALGMTPIIAPLSLGRYPIWGAVLEGDGITQSALALSVAHKNLCHQGEGVRALAVILGGKDIDTSSLSHVYDVLMDKAFADEVGALSVSQIADRLGAVRIPTWQSLSVVIAMPQGLHARPATILSELAKSVQGQINVSVDNGAYVSARSLSKLLSLGASFGQTLTFMAEPDTDAVALLPKIIEAVEQGLGDEIAPLPTASVQTPRQAINTFGQNLPLGEKITAISASKGLAVAGVYVVKPMVFEYPMAGAHPKEEMARLNLAIDDVKEDLKALIESAQKASIAKIFTAHLALLDDEEIIYGAKDGIDEGLSAPASWHAHIEKLVKSQSSLKNHLLAERASDLKDVGQKVLGYLTSQKPKPAPTQPYILIKEELLPSDVAKLDTARVKGIITAFGGASSHSAILARSLGIPYVAGAGMGVMAIDDEAEVLLDANKGWFVVNPDEALIQDCLKRQDTLAQREKSAKTFAHEPAITKDGHRVEVAVNIGNVNETAGAMAEGAEAVGLLRTELVFMAHTQVPDIDTQIADYTKVFEALDGRPLVVRTLDVGGDKPLPYLPMPSEENPFLGVRGIRLSLQEPELLKNQLIALISASKGQDLRIMFPMVGQIEEWQSAKAILDEVLKEYPHNNLQMGIMIEVPSVAIMAEAFAKEVDFFSIGTNDLTQYTLAIDRGHPTLSKDADGLHPSVLQLIHHTVASAHAHGKWVGVCGELAGDEEAVPILVGLGVDELSMSAKSIALTKAQIRGLDHNVCQSLAKKALLCQSAKQVRALVEDM